MRRAYLHAAALLGLVAVLAVAGAARPAPAAAWSLSKSTNGVVIERAATDTTVTVYVTLYYDYKGTESGWSTTLDPFGSSTYRLSENVCNIPSTGGAVEVPLKAGYRQQMVRVYAPPSTALSSFAVLNEPVSVELTGTARMSVTGTPTVSVIGTLPVSVASTISATLPETLTVDPWVTAGLPARWQEYFGYLAAVLLGGGFGWLVVEGFGRWSKL